MIKKGALTGLLLFGIFFGAGNLIFPPSLGTLSGQHFHITRVSDIINSLPFAQASLPWLVPALVGILLSLFLPNKQKSERFEMES